MASRSRVAQEKLQALEKEAATFEQQLVQAAIFVGRDLPEIRRLCEDLEFSGEGVEKDIEKVIYHGREEWLLRWLLKKLQAPKEDVPRRTPSSWWLLCYLLRHIPLINAAQILVERKIISILQLALEEAEKRDAGVAKSDSSSTEQETTKKSSKKRKRSGELVVGSISAEQSGLPNLMVAILATVNFVVESSKISSKTIEEGRSSAFIAEYMKTVIRTSAEAAANILGSWLSLCQKALPSNSMIASAENYLSPFIEIWYCHVAEESQYVQFSLHATKSILALLRMPHASTASWTAQLEALVARSIIIPAKTAMSINTESDLLSSLTRISVIQDSANSSILFDIAIRCTPPPGPRKRRKQQDDTWLAAVFSQLKSSMPDRFSNAIAISSMLQSAIKHKVSVDLDVLRDIVWEHGLAKESENWELVSTVLALDGNVFLIPDEKDVLKELLVRITNASSDRDNYISTVIVKQVLVPLMREFARARDLSGFIKHWHGQLVAFETQRKIRSDDANVFSAWEDEALQKELKALLEPSLTIPQIVQNLDWLQERVSESPDATCVIIEDIAGAISGDEHVVDAIGLRIYHIMFENDAAEKLDTRYKWRSWRIISRTMSWVEHWDIDKLSLMWEQGQKPFDALSKKKRFKHLFKKGKEDNLEILEIMHFSCSALEAVDAEKAGRLEPLATKLLMDLLKAFAIELKTMVTETSAEALTSGALFDVMYPAAMSLNWIYWTFTRCLLVKHPRALEVAMKSEDLDFEEMLQNLFWLASSHFSDADDVAATLSENHAGNHSDLWRLALVPDSLIRQNKKLIRIFIDIMLKSVTNANNPLMKTDTKNTFALHCLHLLGVDDFSKAQREQIMQSWHEPETTVLDPDVLALKVKVMQHPAIYDGMRFKDMVKLADALAKTDDLSDVSVRFEHLVLLKELTRLIFVAVLANADQARNKTYTTEAFEVIRKKVSSHSTKKPLNFAMIGIFEVALAAFHEKEMVLNDHDIVLRDDLEDLTAKISAALVNELKAALTSDENEKQGPKELVVVTIIESLNTLGADPKALSTLESLSGQDISNVGDEVNARAYLSTFLEAHGNQPASESTKRYGDITSINGRDLILQQTRASLSNKTNQQKLALLQSMLTSEPDQNNTLHWSKDLSKFLSIRHIISSIQKEKSRIKEPDIFSLSAAYTILAEHFPTVTSIREFCLVAETLQLMLKTKSYSMCQYNIDCTIGAITILCSAKAPSLPPTHAGTIYTHLCNLIQSILMHHRLKLQGHTHLAQQTMQSLLRCLFIPSHPSSQPKKSTALQGFAPLPPWHSPLTTHHSKHYLTLLLYISDPPLSTLSSSSSHQKLNPLISLKDKAKRISAQWTKFLLQEYIYLLLDPNVRMEGKIREGIKEGWWCVLENLGGLGRDAVRGELDAGGRAVFRGIWEEWVRVGGGGRRET